MDIRGGKMSHLIALKVQLCEDHVKALLPDEDLKDEDIDLIFCVICEEYGIGYVVDVNPIVDIGKLLKSKLRG